MQFCKSKLMFDVKYSVHFYTKEKIAKAREKMVRGIKNLQWLWYEEQITRLRQLAWKRQLKENMMEIYKILFTGIEKAKKEWSSAVCCNARPKVLVH